MVFILLWCCQYTSWLNPLLWVWFISFCYDAVNILLDWIHYSGYGSYYFAMMLSIYFLTESITLGMVHIILLWCCQYTSWLNPLLWVWFILFCYDAVNILLDWIHYSGYGSYHFAMMLSIYFLTESITLGMVHIILLWCCQYTSWLNPLLWVWFILFCYDAVNILLDWIHYSGYGSYYFAMMLSIYFLTESITQGMVHIILLWCCQYTSWLNPLLWVWFISFCYDAVNILLDWIHYSGYGSYHFAMMLSIYFLTESITLGMVHIILLWCCQYTSWLNPLLWVWFISFCYDAVNILLDWIHYSGYGSHHFAMMLSIYFLTESITLGMVDIILLWCCKYTSWLNPLLWVWFISFCYDAVNILLDWIHYLGYGSYYLKCI